VNIAVIGHACIDRNISKHGSYTAPGGPVIFIAKVFNKLPKINIKIIAPSTQLNQNETLIYENISKGNRRFQKAFNLRYAKPVPINNRLKKIVSESDVIFFAPLTPDYRPSYISSLLNKTKKNAVKIISPQGYYRSFDKNNSVIQREFIEGDDILPLFDFVIVSDEDHKNMEQIARIWSKKIKVIVTQGYKGSKYFYKNRSILVKSDPVKIEDIVDSVGSGDIFTASFGYKYFLTKDISKSLRFANNIARQCLFFPANDLRFTI
jgi:sugar/nucleoside kinase (ribokinase family)